MATSTWRPHKAKSSPGLPQVGLSCAGPACALVLRQGRCPGIRRHLGRIEDLDRGGDPHLPPHLPPRMAERWQVCWRGSRDLVMPGGEKRGEWGGLGRGGVSDVGVCACACVHVCVRVRVRVRVRGVSRCVCVLGCVWITWEYRSNLLSSTVTRSIVPRHQAPMSSNCPTTPHTRRYACCVQKSSRESCGTAPKRCINPVLSTCVSSLWSRAAEIAPGKLRERSQTQNAKQTAATRTAATKRLDSSRADRLLTMCDDADDEAES